jgi:hypothetical protein
MRSHPHGEATDGRAKEALGRPVGALNSTIDVNGKRFHIEGITDRK